MLLSRLAFLVNLLPAQSKNFITLMFLLCLFHFTGSTTSKIDINLVYCKSGSTYSRRLIKIFHKYTHAKTFCLLYYLENKETQITVQEQNMNYDASKVVYKGTCSWEMEYIGETILGLAIVPSLRRTMVDHCSKVRWHKGHSEYGWNYPQFGFEYWWTYGTTQFEPAGHLLWHWDQSFN